MASKVLPILGGVMLFFFLPLIIVVALILGGLSSFDAMASSCEPSGTGASFAWPTDQHDIEQGWQDPDPDTGASHSGTDFDVDEGSKVYAAADGEITSIANNEVRIRHDQGVETRYKYFHDISVKVHDKVERGQQIGTSGSGDETAPGESGEHLHFEIWIDKKDDGNFENTKPEDDAFGDADQDTGGCGCGTSELSGSNNQQKAFNYLVSNGYSKEQAAGIVGNMINESQVQPQLLNGDPPGKVTTPAEALKHPIAWGLVQWYPGSKMINPSRGASVDDETIGSLAYQLEFLKKQLLGQGPLPEKAAGDAVRAAKTVEDAAFQFGFKFERFTLNANDPEFNERKADAREVYNTFAGGAPANGSGGGESACGAGSGNIAAVAMSLAWPSTGHDTQPYADHATNAYKANFFRYNKTAKSAGDVGWTDCGRFVATVMHMSGADPDYPDVYTPTQEHYLRTSGKYEVHDDWDVSKLKPGDILIGPGHTYLFVGPWADGHNSASASLDGDAPGPGHVPEASNAYEVGTTYAVARLKK